MYLPIKVIKEGDLNMVNEQQTTERQAADAVREASKRQAKKQERKIFWNIVKTAIIPVLMVMVKIMAVAFAVLAVVAVFDSILDGGGTGSRAEDGNYTSSGSISIWGCNLSREEFIEAAESYNAGADYQTYMAAYAGNFYDICTEYDINPCYAYAHSMWETGNGSSTECKQDKNYFGYMTYNGQSSGKVYSSVDEAIEDYCEWIIDTSTEGSDMYNMNNNKGNEFAEVNDKFNGTPSNNIYVLFCTYSYLGDNHVCDEPDFDNPLGIDGYMRAGNSWGKRWKNYDLQYI